MDFLGTSFSTVSAAKLLVLFIVEVYTSAPACTHVDGVGCQELTDKACPDDGYEAYERCWYMGEAGASCDATCNLRGLEMSWYVPDSEDPMVPRLLNREPAEKQSPWGSLECYVSGDDRYHTADSAGVGATNLGQFTNHVCSMACPCALPQESPTPSTTPLPTESPTETASRQCIRVITGTEYYANGYLRVYVDFGSGLAPQSSPYMHERGSTVVAQCYDEIRSVQVENTFSDGWIGSIEYSPDDQQHWETMRCVDCSSGVDDTQVILVDGDGDGSSLSVALCINGAVCTLLKKQDAPECVYVATAGAEASDGTLTIAISSSYSGGAWTPYLSPGAHYSRGETVLDRCFPILHGVQVQNPTADAWVGVVQSYYVLGNGSETARQSMLCVQCTQGTDGGDIVVDGSADSDGLASTWCFNRETCTLNVSYALSPTASPTISIGEAPTPPPTPSPMSSPTPLPSESPTTQPTSSPTEPPTMECRVTLYDDEGFAGQSYDLGRGDHPTGPWHEQISSLKVFGPNCVLRTYVDADYNGQEAVFPAGDYDHSSMEARGLPNDAISSLKVVEEAPIPGFSCAERETAFNDAGGVDGNSIFMDRHNLDCDGQPMSQWQMVFPEGGDQMKFRYTCCTVPHAPSSCETQYTDWNEHGDSVQGSVIFLDRYQLRCAGAKQVLTGWTLEHNGENVNCCIRFRMQCCSVEEKKDCLDHYTADQYMGDGAEGRLQSISLHNVRCDYGTVLSSWLLTRQGDDQIRYHYQCCGVMPEARLVVALSVPADLSVFSVEDVEYVPADNSFRFNGGTSVASIARPIVNDFAINFEFRTTQAEHDASGEWWVAAGLIDADAAVTNNDFGISIGAGRIMFGIGNPDTTITSSDTYNDGQWHEVFAHRERSSGDFGLYIDGGLVGASSGNTEALDSSETLRLGRNNVNSFQGELRDVRIYNYFKQPPAPTPSPTELPTPSPPTPPPTFAPTSPYARFLPDDHICHGSFQIDGSQADSHASTVDACHRFCLSNSQCTHFGYTESRICRLYDGCETTSSKLATWRPAYTYAIVRPPTSPPTAPAFPTPEPTSESPPTPPDRPHCSGSPTCSRQPSISCASAARLAGGQCAMACDRPPPPVNSGGFCLVGMN